MKNSNLSPWLPDASSSYDYICRFTEAVKRNRNLILLCLISTFIWGLTAHSYAFLHSSFSHDSLNEFNAAIYGNDLRIQFGRVFVPVYRTFARGNIALPWIIGLLSLLYISIAVLLTVKLFDIRSNVFTVLISGIYTVNLSVIATVATYIHDLDCNMLSLTMAVLSVYLWKQYPKAFLCGAVPLCLSIGLYQSYISVAITLFLLCLIIELLDGESFGSTFQRGVKAIGLILCAGGLYYLAMKCICGLYRIPQTSGEYNSIDTVLSLSLSEILFFFAKGYLRTCYRILTVYSAYPAPISVIFHGIIIAVPGVIILLKVFQKKQKVKEKLLLLFLIALLPIGMHAVYTLTGGFSHLLMEYGFCLIYLFILLVAWWAERDTQLLNPPLQKALRLLAVCLIFIILWGNTQTANTLYLKKDLEQKANLSLFTRIVYRMEDCDEYVTGETPIVFVVTPPPISTDAHSGTGRDL